MINCMKKVLFCGSHSDDEFCAAGTLHRLGRLGSEVHIITMSPAAIETDRVGGDESFEVVSKEWDKSMDLIGARMRRLVGFRPSADFRSHRQEMCQIVFDACEREEYDAAFILSPDDQETAHSVLGIECERVMRGRVPIIIRCRFPWNRHGNEANLYVKLDGDDLDCKRRVIAAYESQKFRYDYAGMLQAYCVADGLAMKSGPVEKFEILRAVL